MLYIYYSSLSKAAAFLMEGINLENVKVIEMKICSNKILKTFYYILTFWGMYKYAFIVRYGSYCYASLQKKDIDVLFWDVCPLKNYTYFIDLVKSPNKSIFFWNPLRYREKNETKIQYYINKLKLSGYRLSTFDPEDSKNFKLEKLCNVNRKVNRNLENGLKYDFYFLGASKGRTEKLRKLELFLRGKGYRTCFKIIESNKDRITFMENIILSAQSKCIVDLTSKTFQQSGLTLRPFDALFLEKKLITDNKNILKVDFYNSNNIFLLNEENYDGIIEFMKKEYIKTTLDISNQYEINNWLLNNYINKIIKGYDKKQIRFA